MPEAPSENTPNLMRQVLAIGPQIETVIGIYQLRGSYSVDRERMENPERTHLHAAERHSAKTSIAGRVITVDLDLAIQGFEEEPQDGGALPANPLFEVYATYRVVYGLAQEINVEPRALEAFGSINGRFNLTAYWREFVQSCCSRAAIAPVAIGPFNAAAAIRALSPPPTASTQQPTG